ncbi:gp53-like domain-containing protein [Escherichia coli]|uniref:gp53-like domain-containing protein n=1 Tax=Escherichia coli TaxID=562 RepID=UPI003D9C961F
MPALISGFTAGKASSAQVNKVIRQASFIAAALAQFVSDKTQRDVLDNGDLPGFVELLGSGFAVEYLSRKNPFGDIKSDGTVKTALENLGLGEAAKRNVGTGANQIPDMGSFTLSVSGTGYQKLPSGFILQWGSIGAPGIAQDVVTHFPIAFPNRCLRVLVSQDYTPDSGAVGYIACAGFSPDPVKFISRASTPGLGASFLALGC